MRSQLEFDFSSQNSNNKLYINASNLCPSCKFLFSYDETDFYNCAGYVRIVKENEMAFNIYQDDAIKKSWHIILRNAGMWK